MNRPTLISRSRMFNGSQERYRHFSAATRCEMTFSVYLPPQALQGYRVPVLYCLSGLGCTDENFSAKAGAQRFAAQWGIALAVPDTSPRGAGTADSRSRGLGRGAGFYLDATEQPWAANYQMYSYTAYELPGLIEAFFPVNGQRSISGHSMGGHGALQIALNNPGRYAAVSAFAPVADPSRSPLARRAFSAYLGLDPAAWARYDTARLAATAEHRLPVLIDQGSADEYCPQELQPQAFADAARGNGFNVQYNLREGYGHGYEFVATFIDSHIEFHADALGL